MLDVQVNSTTPSGTITNTATVATDSGSDTNSTDDRATASTDVTGATTSFGLTVVDSPDPVRPLDTLTYTITVTNNGPSETIDPTLSNSIP